MKLVSVIAGCILISSWARAADTRPIIVAFGDSLTAGYGVDPDEALPALIGKKIEEARLDERFAAAEVD